MIRTTEFNGVQHVSVTSAMTLVKTVLKEEPDSYGPPALARVHAEEGSGCHAVCLDWLAWTHGLLPAFVPPSWNPAIHPDEARWRNVLANAQQGFQEFCEQYAVTPIGIEQEVFSRAYGLVGHVDLYCELTWHGKRRRVVVDLKFVAKLLATHRLQLRCYGKCLPEAQLGILYHASRETGLWQVELVDLTVGLEDVAAVANAARLWSWAEQKKA